MKIRLSWEGSEGDPSLIVVGEETAIYIDLEPGRHDPPPEAVHVRAEEAGLGHPVQLRRGPIEEGKEKGGFYYVLVEGKRWLPWTLWVEARSTGEEGHQLATRRLRIVPRRGRHAAFALSLAALGFAVPSAWLLLDVAPTHWPQIMAILTTLAGGSAVWATLSLFRDPRRLLWLGIANDMRWAAIACMTSLFAWWVVPVHVTRVHNETPGAVQIKEVGQHLSTPLGAGKRTVLLTKLSEVKTSDLLQLSEGKGLERYCVIEDRESKDDNCPTDRRQETFIDKWLLGHTHTIRLRCRSDQLDLCKGQKDCLPGFKPLERDKSAESDCGDGAQEFQGKSADLLTWLDKWLGPTREGEPKAGADVILSHDATRERLENHLRIRLRGEQTDMQLVMEGDAPVRKVTVDSRVHPRDGIAITPERADQSGVLRIDVGFGKEPRGTLTCKFAEHTSLLEVWVLAPELWGVERLTLQSAARTDWSSDWRLLRPELPFHALACVPKGGVQPAEGERRAAMELSRAWHPDGFWIDFPSDVAPRSVDVYEAGAGRVGRLECPEEPKVRIEPIAIDGLPGDGLVHRLMVGDSSKSAWTRDDPQTPWRLGWAWICGSQGDQKAHGVDATVVLRGGSRNARLLADNKRKIVRVSQGRLCDVRRNAPRDNEITPADPSKFDCSDADPAWEAIYGSHWRSKGCGPIQTCTEK